jgi:hypothetical protein
MTVAAPVPGPPVTAATWPNSFGSRRSARRLVVKAAT